jgi:hypothetical protein
MTSELRVDNLKGSTTGGSINVLGEGTSATTNLQQGLAKNWCRIVQTGTQSIGDSFNTSSISDNGTGRSFFNFSNAMGNSNYSVLATSNQEGAGGEHSTFTTAQYEIRSYANDGSLTDGSQISTGILGDLA